MSKNIHTFLRLLICVPIIAVFFMTGRCSGVKEAYEHLFGKKEEAPPSQMENIKPQFTSPGVIKLNFPAPTYKAAPAVKAPTFNIQKFKVAPAVKAPSYIVNPVKTRTDSYDPMELVTNSKEPKNYLTLPQ